MKRWILFSVGLFLCFQTSLSDGQKKPHFYNVDSEKTVEGTIREIRMEPRYKGAAPFLVISLEEKGSRAIYTVEVSPVWFFETDFHQGEDVEVIGSFYVSDGQSLNLIAREIRFRGETLLLRDKHGFPNWRGGQAEGKGRRRGKKIKGL